MKTSLAVFIALYAIFMAIWVFELPPNEGGKRDLLFAGAWFISGLLIILESTF